MLWCTSVSSAQIHWKWESFELDLIISFTSFRFILSIYMGNFGRKSKRSLLICPLLYYSLCLPDFFPKVLFMVPWEIQRWNSTAAWPCALVVRMPSTATVEGKQLFPRVRLHAFEVGRIHCRGWLNRKIWLPIEAVGREQTGLNSM